MSLIHEALRRADEDQCRRDAGVEGLGPPPLPPDDPQTASARRSPWLICLAGVLVVFAGVAAYAVWWGIGAAREEAGLAVRSAAARLQQAAGRAASGRKARAMAAQTRPSVPAKGAAADAETSVQETSSDSQRPVAEIADTIAATPSTADAGTSGPAPAGITVAVPVAPAEEALASRWTPDLLLKTSTDTPAPTEVVPTGDPESALFDRMVAVLESAAREAVRRQAEVSDKPSDTGTVSPASLSNVVPAADPTPSQSRSGAEADEPSETPTKTTPKTAAEPGPVIDPSKVKISSIMVGPNGNLAVINGRPVRIGDSVLGATVVGITSRSVEVEKDGRRATLGL